MDLFWEENFDEQEDFERVSCYGFGSLRLTIVTAMTVATTPASASIPRRPGPVMMVTSSVYG